MACFVMTPSRAPAPGVSVGSAASEPTDTQLQPRRASNSGALSGDPGGIHTAICGH